MRSCIHNADHIVHLLDIAFISSIAFTARLQTANGQSIHTIRIKLSINLGVDAVLNSPRTMVDTEMVSGANGKRNCENRQTT